MRVEKLLAAACAVAALASFSCRGTSRPVPRVVVVGLDGADWEIIDRLAAAGRLPRLDRLRREGASGPLRSEAPFLSPVVWTTIATGRSPLDHGIYGFLTRRAGRDEPVRSDERRVRAFWDVAGESGLKVGIVGWYSTWPAEKVSGFMVSDRAGSHQVSGGAGKAVERLIEPGADDEILAKLRGEVVAAIDARTAESYFGEAPGAPALPADKMETFVGALRTTELYRRLFPELLKRHGADVAAVYFEGTDAVGHLFADYGTPPIPGADPRAVARYGGAFDKYYETIDKVVGEIADQMDRERGTLIIVSDHGFKTGRIRPMTPTTGDAGNQAPLWHRPEGIVLMWGAGVRAGARIEGATVYDVAPTICRLAGLPVSQKLQGRPLDGALTAEAVARPLKSVEDYESRGPRSTEAPPAPAADDERIAQLRALGYVGGAAPSTAAAGGEGQLAVPINLYNRGVMLANRGRIDEARGDFVELQKRAPDDPLGFVGEGLVMLNAGRAEAALPPLARAVQLDPRLPAAQAYAGEALLRLGRDTDAAEAFARALALDPSAGRPALMLGQILVHHGRIDDADALFARARETAELPEDRAGGWIGGAIVAETRRRLGEAEADYRRALALAPDFPPALERYGNLLLFMDRAAEAAPLLQRLTERRPGDPQAWRLYAVALAKLGRIDEARGAERRAAGR